MLHFLLKHFLTKRTLLGYILFLVFFLIILFYLNFLVTATKWLAFLVLHTFYMNDNIAGRWDIACCVCGFVNYGVTSLGKYITNRWPMHLCNCRWIVSSVARSWLFPNRSCVQGTFVGVKYLRVYFKAVNGWWLCIYNGLITIIVNEQIFWRKTVQKFPLILVIV